MLATRKVFETVWDSVRKFQTGVVYTITGPKININKPLGIVYTRPEKNQMVGGLFLDKKGPRAALDAVLLQIPHEPTGGVNWAKKSQFTITKNVCVYIDVTQDIAFT